MRATVITAAALAASACATVTRGDKQAWTVTSVPPNAAVQTSNGLSCPSTPCTFRMKRKSEFDVTVSKAGYSTYQGHVTHQVAGAGAAGMAGNVLVGGVIGAGVDVATGATLELKPNPLAVTLEPSGATAASSGPPLGTPAAAAPPPPAEASAATGYDWARRPSAREIGEKWPDLAMAKGIGGEAVIACAVTAGGALRDCRVESETPGGVGFGAAALALAPRFRLRSPAAAAGTPVRVPMVWPNPDGTMPGAEDAGLLVANPVWAAAPLFDEVAAAYPAGGGGKTGVVHMRCRFDGAGGASACTVTDEAPPNLGFAGAALSLSRFFRLQTDPLWAADDRRLFADITVRLPPPGDPAFASRPLAPPRWVFQLDPASAMALYPSRATAAGIRSGVGQARCTVAADGALSACVAGAAMPERLGFSEAAVAVARVMRMNPWADDGSPVNGATVTVPVRFELPQRSAAGRP